MAACVFVFRREHQSRNLLSFAPLQTLSNADSMIVVSAAAREGK